MRAQHPHPKHNTNARHPQQCTTPHDATTTHDDNGSAPVRYDSDPQYDLCAQAPNVCNEQGQLIKLALVGGETGNLACDAFPKSIARFTRLEVLDLSYNSLLGTLSEVRAAPAACVSRQPQRMYV